MAKAHKKGEFNSNEATLETVVCNILMTDYHYCLAFSLSEY